jgi:hypothetical protein
MVFFSFRIFFSDDTRVRTFIFFVAQGAIFFPEFNIRLYDKNSESDYYFFLHQNQNIFSATLGIRIFFFRKKNPIPSPPFKLNGRSLSETMLPYTNNYDTVCHGNYDYISSFLYISFCRSRRRKSTWDWRLDEVISVMILDHLQV